MIFFAISAHSGGGVGRRPLRLYLDAILEEMINSDGRPGQVGLEN